MSQATIVVPCYNEEKRIPVEEFQAFASGAPGIRFLFVDDGSTDGTGRVLQSLCNARPAAFALLSLKPNRGKAEAVRQGLLKAFEGTLDYVGFWDADLSTPLSAILDFCSLLDSRPGIEMVFGARVQLLGRCIQRHPVRHYLGRAFATVASWMLGLKVYDTQCGAKLFRASPDLAALFQQPFATGWIFDVEIVARLIQARRGTALPQARDIIYEYPLNQWRDVEGSKITPSAFLKATVEMVAIHRTYLRGR